MRIGVLGGDGRLDEVARGLAERGFSVGRWGGGNDTEPLSEPLNAEAFVLPYPMTRDGVHLFCPNSQQAVLRLDVLQRALENTGKTVVGGRIPAFFRKTEGVRWFDFEQSEALVLENADVTAEAAVFLAMRDLPVTLRGSRVALLGFGRIGKRLAVKLLGLGAQVTVFARRRESLCEARLFGCEAVLWESEKSIRKIPADTVAVFSTVPERILSVEALQQAPVGILWMDLASPPGTWNHAEAQKVGISDLWATGLPGKFAPLTAGKILLDAVLEFLAEDAPANHETNLG